MNGWLILLGLVNAYILLIVWLVRSGRMERWNLSLLLGFILMIRTQKGRKALEVVAKPRRLWNLFGDFGIVLTFAGMALMTIVMILIIPTTLDPQSGIEPLGASEILIIPGVTPFVPLWYGIIALIVTLIVHEGGHGVLALANKMRVKNLGLLYMIVPVGAFVEPDEDDLMESPRRHRLRVYAAGATVNIVIAVGLLVAAGALVGAMTPHDGTPLASIVGTPAADAGLEPGDILVAAGNTSIDDTDAFFAYMATAQPGQNVTFTTRAGDAKTAVLGDRWTHAISESDRERILAEDPVLLQSCGAVLGLDETPNGTVCSEGLYQQPFLGVQPFLAPEQQARLAAPFGTMQNFLLWMSLPIGEIQGAPFLTFYLPEFYETPFQYDSFWMVLNLTFWVFWINLMVGLTNILPMLPLDGGHLFRDGMAGVLGRLRPKMAHDVRDRIVGRLAGVMSLIILAAVLLQFLGPRIAQAFA